ncbi:porin [Paraburkholderia phytofirmans]|uniref:porin n=1 Tax=Paraburkholderia phytofirmans TaxID=261302 RepID=UPI0038BCB34C
MRRATLACAAGVFVVATVVAQAQSSVRLYGVVDESITYTNNQKGSSNVQQTGNRVGGSRWGLRGIEELGDGLKAVFTLENGFRPNDGTFGQASREFGRQAFVGIAKTGIGRLTLGHQYEPIADLVARFAGPGLWSPATHIGDNDNLNQTFRINNAAKFRSDAIGGFTVDALYGFSNQANSGNGQGFGNNRAWGTAANYVNGPFSIGGGYVVLDRPDAKSNTSGAVGGTIASDDYGGVLFYGLDGGVERQQIAAAGGNYVFGPTTVGFAFSQTRLDYNDGSSRKFNNYDANLQYLLKPAVTLIGVYTFTDGRADGLTGLSGKQLKPRWHQFTLGLDYALSARTDLYLSGVYQLAAGDASTRVGSGYQKIAAIADVGTPSSTNRQVAVLGGLRVKF